MGAKSAPTLNREQRMNTYLRRHGLCGERKRGFKNRLQLSELHGVKTQRDRKCEKERNNREAVGARPGRPAGPPGPPPAGIEARPCIHFSLDQLGLVARQLHTHNSIIALACSIASRTT